MQLNTGGTSGQPLPFYVDRNAFAREWAHMHAIWVAVGYRHDALKLTFRGKNLGAKPLRYNAVHHEYLVNAYAPDDIVMESIRRLLRRRTINYLHGYPSSIYSFAVACREQAPDIARRLRESLRGILLGSEWPAPVYRSEIEAVLGARTVSWYGHSEMAVLARESAPFVYAPLQSYGFCEAVISESGWRLIGTSYCNTASPFIRYDTGDRVEPEFSNQLLSSFRVSQGRVGEFVLDGNGKRISLTALVFGRHHRLFDVARFVQVSQLLPGEATLHVTVPPGAKRDWQHDFDGSNVAIRFSVKLRINPWRSPSGKIPLLIPSNASDTALSNGTCSIST